jgi:hypothetical protein
MQLPESDRKTTLAPPLPAASGTTDFAWNYSGDGALELVSGPGVLAQQVRMVLGDGYIRESLPALQVPSTRQLIFEPILNPEMALDIIVSEVNDVLKMASAGLVCLRSASTLTRDGSFSQARLALFDAETGGSVTAIL